MKIKHVTVKEGDIIQCDTLRWDDGWEFGCPSMMISPVIRCFENGNNHAQIVEDVLIDAVVKGTISDADFNAEWGWRGYKLPVLRRRFKEALAGKKFPIAGYWAQRTLVKIIKQKDGLFWEEISATPK